MISRSVVLVSSHFKTHDNCTDAESGVGYSKDSHTRTAGALANLRITHLLLKLTGMRN